VPQRFSQKKALLALLKERAAAYDAAEAKLCEAAEALAPSEEHLYSTACQLAEKVEFVQIEMEEMLDAGRLTKSEKKDMICQVGSNERVSERPNEKTTGFLSMKRS
jgi:hypothetical protein